MEILISYPSEGVPWYAYSFHPSSDNYVIPVYPKYINNGSSIDLSMAQEVWDMGEPKAIERFKSPLADGGVYQGIQF